jgi:hypothetical protein
MQARQRDKCSSAPQDNGGRIPVLKQELGIAPSDACRVATRLRPPFHYIPYGPHDDCIPLLVHRDQGRLTFGFEPVWLVDNSAAS